MAHKEKNIFGSESQNSVAFRSFKPGDLLIPKHDFYFATEPLRFQIFEDQHSFDVQAFPRNTQAIPVFELKTLCLVKLDFSETVYGQTLLLHPNSGKILAINSVYILNNFKLCI